MKFEELKATEIYARFAEEVYDDFGDSPQEQEYYRKEHADAAIAELKAENERLKGESCKLTDGCLRLKQCRREKANLADELRATKRALWLARASEASKEVNYWTCQDESSYAIVDFNVRHETIVSYKAPHHRPYKWILIWENVERKCLKKSKEYL